MYNGIFNEFTEEEADEKMVSINNLLYLYDLKDQGYDIKDFCFGFCGCGECTNDPFLGAVIMIIMGIDNENEFSIEYYDAEEWGEENQVEIIEPEVVRVIEVEDEEANPDLIPMVESSSIIKLTVGTNGIGKKFWCLVMDGWETGAEEIGDIFIQIQKLKEGCL
ncbi:hypothetical protein [Syntrophomonas palmitatica]|uniref:hypothetical protein n=1 Tax=Syntrophomonas palmitatica TaxID=402877 RepID=UPI0006D155EE|nr:hypothetical protein [Syntrophomonas palmitatica]